MDAAHLILSLEQTPHTLSPLLAGLSDQDAAWRPAPGAWSIVEIAGHMLDEEREDFRPRLQSTLHDPQAAWTPIDPEAAVRLHDHAARSTSEVWSEFLEERRASLLWLHALPSPDWALTHTHPELGPISAGDLLTSWAAHDLLHLRQITTRLFGRIEAAGAPHTPRYAGPLT